MSIAVLLPFRDASATIGEALRSILVDDIPLEVIAIDDGSRDGGADVVRALRDPRVRVLRTDGVGIAQAMSVGLAATSAPFIARMDADDVSLPGRFAAQRRALETASVVGTRVEAFGDVGEGTRRYVAWMNGVVTAVDHAREIFVESPLCNPSVMMRRDALVAVGAFREPPCGGPEDYDLWLRFDAAGHRMIKLPEVLLRWRHHAARVTLRDPRYARARFPIMKAPWLARRLDRPFAIWGAGKTGKHLARALEAEGLFPERFHDIDPRKIGGVARGRPIVDTSELGDALIVVAVGEPGAREIVRAQLLARGRREGEHFLCAS